MSSALVYGAPSRSPIPEDEPPRPVFPYACSKLAGERLVQAFGRAHGCSCAVVRPFVVYGPGEAATARAEVSQYVRALQNGHAPEILGDPDLKTRDFVHVHDVVEALCVVAGSELTGAVNIGTGVETSLRELAELAALVLGQDPPRLSPLPSPHDEYRLVADTTRLDRLGFRPRIGLADGIAALAAHVLPARPVNGVPRRSRPASPIGTRHGV